MEFRKGQEAGNASINRELSIMQSAFSMAYKETPRRVTEKLYFDRLPESKGRQGFVEEKTHRAIAENCMELYLRAMLALAYSFGSRKGELLGLKVGDVDLLAGSVRLQTSKNGEPRQVNLRQETRQLLSACVTGKGPEDCVFTRNGKAVSDFRGTWDKVTTAAGCPGLLFHDLRRSAVRNMVRNGIPEVVCMKISGHKTRAVFDRYNIVSERDLTEATQKIESSQLSYRQAKWRKSESFKCAKLFFINGPEWRNWQTQQTQNLPGITPRVGSTPSSGTIFSLHLSGSSRSRSGFQEVCSRPWRPGRADAQARQDSSGPLRYVGLRRSESARLNLSLFFASPLSLFPVCLPGPLPFPQPRAGLYAIRPANRQGRGGRGVPLPCRRRLQLKKFRQFPGLPRPRLRLCGLPLSNSRSFLPALLSFPQSCFCVPFPSLPRIIRSVKGIAPCAHG
jgi:site-specific recombinase XerD